MKKSEIMTGPEAFEEIRLSTANIVGPVTPSPSVARSASVPSL